MPKKTAMLHFDGSLRSALTHVIALRTKRSLAFTLGVRPTVIVPRRVFVGLSVKPRKMKVPGFSAGRFGVPCNSQSPAGAPDEDAPWLLPILRTVLLY